MNKISQKLVVETEDAHSIDALTNEYTSYYSEEIKYRLTTEINSIEQIQVPADIFAGRTSPARALVRFLAETKQMPLKEVAKILHKSYANTWISYKKAKSLHNSEHEQGILENKGYGQAGYFIPLSAFSHNGFLTVFEALVVYMKKFFTFSQISRIVKKDPRTIWTVYSRAKKKMESKE